MKSEEYWTVKNVKLRFGIMESWNDGTMGLQKMEKWAGDITVHLADQ
jgi:hypothetical protein